MWLSLLLVTILVTCSARAPVETENSSLRSDEDPYRLPTTVLPTAYTVTIVVEDDFAPNGVFTGSVSIELQVQEEIEEFTLHARDLDIDESKIQLTCGESANIFKSLTYEEDYHKITVAATVVIKAESSCNLKIEDYKGQLKDDMNGFYRSSYENADGKIEWLGTTQFQPVHARRAFPCFDEPSFKATFSLIIQHPSDYSAVSNTPISSSANLESGLVQDTFETTPIMSTYLVAFLVSKFKYKESWANYKVYTREEALDTAEFISLVTPYFIQNMEKFTDIEYASGGITKVDQVAVPDFDAGAMENWGLITYRERLLLWDADNSANSYKQSLVVTVAHELSHMWFGDMVTCQWWSYTWLNEGFARYFQYMIPREVDEFDEWELDKQFITLVVQTIFPSDSVQSATPLTSSASTPSDITNKFNTITYSKGASVIRMVEFFMGTENFTTALQTYLKAHKHGSTVPEDLFNALSEYSSNLPEGRTFKDVLTLWTEQPGFPLIQVKLSGADVIITQKRFFYDSSATSNLMWDVPLTYTTSHSVDFENTTSPVWFPAIKSSITIPNILHGGTGWVIFNLQEIGYYRVNYDETLWSEIEAALKSEDFGGIHLLNRAQIVDDILNLARAGEVTYTRALDVVSYLVNETEYYPWYSALTALSFVKRRIGNDDTLSDLLKSYVSDLIDNALETVPFNDTKTDHIFTLKRSLLLSWSCELDIGDCVSNSQEAFDKFKTNGVNVDPNLRSVVYCNALRYSDSSDEFYFLWEKYLATKLATEQVTILNALGCTKNESLLKEYLEKTISSDSKIRVQDYSTVYSSVYGSNYEGLAALFAFLKDNYKVLPNYYSSWGSLFSNLAERFTTSAEIEELRDFYETNKDSLTDVANTIESAITTAEANIQWTASVKTELTSYLRSSAAVNSLSIFFSFATTLLILSLV